MEVENIKQQVLLELAVQQSFEAGISGILDKMLPLYMRKLNCFMAAVISAGKSTVVVPHAFRTDPFMAEVEQHFATASQNIQKGTIEWVVDTGFIYGYRLHNYGWLILGKKQPLGPQIKMELRAVVNQFGLTLSHTQESERLKLFSNLINFSSDAIQVATEEGRLFYINNIAEQRLGIRASEAGNYFVKDIEPIFEKEGAWEKHVQELKKAGSMTLEGNHVNQKTGKVVHVEVSIKFTEISGKGFVIAISRDITARKLYEAQLKEAKAEAERANKAKSEFLANISHEIRTPMNSILGFSEVILNTSAGERQKSHLKTILDSGKTLLSLINDILDLSKIEAGKMVIANESTDLRNIVGEILRLFQQKSREDYIQLIQEIDDNFPEIIIIDEVRLRQVLLNLVGNALKFTHKGYVKVHIEVLADHGKTIDFSISVIDTGIGISKYDSETIFESFKQKAGHDARKYGGTGLGLSISKRLTELMGGEISLTSQPGKGSTFKLTFRNIPKSEKSTKQSKDYIWEDDKIIFKNAKVLIVDDVKHNRELVTAYLEGHNLELFEAENGEAAVELARLFIPDLILMDIRMPGMNGYEATEIIRNDPATSHIPVLALTASNLASELVIIKKVFDSHLFKPVQKNIFLKELARFLDTEKIPAGQNDNGEATKSLPSQIIDNSIKADFAARFTHKIAAQMGFLIVDEISELVEELKEFATANNLSLLAEKCEELETDIEDFDFEKIQKGLAEIKRMFI